MPALLALGWAISPQPVEGQEEAVIVYLVRHAERADDEGPVDPAWGADPPLSQAGARRALELADVLESVGVRYLHSTDYARTRQTAEPLSASTGVPIELYDPGDLEGLARRLRATPGTHVVVGHSNTTPELVEALGGSPEGPIAELEYDRAYVVYVLPGGATGSAVFRYGAPYRGRP